MPAVSWKRGTCGMRQPWEKACADAFLIACLGCGAICWQWPSRDCSENAGFFGLGLGEMVRRAEQLNAAAYATCLGRDAKTGRE